MKLYTYPASPVCRPVQMFIADNKMDVELQIVDLMTQEQYKPAYAAINPNNAVPVLEDGAFRLTECSAILKYLADSIDSPAYPKDLKERARVNSAMDWVNTALYRNFGYGLCYPQVLPFAKLPDEKAQSLVLANGQAGARRYLSVMNDSMLGAGNPYLCGKNITIADYFASGIISLGELMGQDFAEWPNVKAWYARMQTLPNWQSANAGLYGWAAAVKGQEFVRV